jgi:uncharacterized membrane protein YhiD involved in acid resistance
MQSRGWFIVLIVALLAGLFGYGLVNYIGSDKKPAGASAQRQAATQTATPQTRQSANSNNANTQNTQPTTTTDEPADEEEESFLARFFGDGQKIPGQSRSEDWIVTILRIIMRLILATMLSAVLAFRPRKDLPMMKRNLYVAQTQILLAVVASALMMIVGDNAARAFGIFAAVSLVRFRTNIRDPKEITVLLISLSLGLATGVGRWDLALVVCLFVLPLLWLLESRESEQVFRAMQLTVKTHDTEATQDILKQIFQRHGFNAELREINPPDEKEPIGCITYYVNMSLNVSTDQISEEIRASDPKNLEGIEWEQKKDSSYVYQ